MKARLMPALVLACLCSIVMLAPSGQRAATNHPRILAAAAAAPAAKKVASSPVIPASQPVLPVATPAEPPARVTRVSISTGSDGQAVINVGTTRLVQITPFRLTHPPRLVVDLLNTEMGRAQRVVASQAGALEDVRVDQFQVTPSTITRVVADLSASEPFRTNADQNGVHIQVQGTPLRLQTARPSQAKLAKRAGRDQAAASSSRQRFTSITPAANKTPVVTLPRRAERREARATAALKATLLQPNIATRRVAPVDENVDLARPVQVDWEAARPPQSSITQPDQVHFSGRMAAENQSAPVAPARPIEVASLTPPRHLPSLLPQARQALRAAEVLSGTRPNQAFPVLSSIPSSPGVRTVPPVYTGKLISLDLKAVDIRDFFRLIHQVSGLNIIVDSDVTGKVTMVLDDVPWDQALDLVLKNNGLGKVLEGNVLRIATVKTLTAEAESQSALRDAKLESEPLVTVFRRLKYAHAEDQKPTTSGGSIGGGGGGASQSNTTPIPGVATILKTFQKGSVLTARGSVVADPRDNAVIVTDVASQIPIIESVIDQLDAKSKQVSIQVRVILANSTFTRTLSSVLSGAFGSAKGHTNGAGGTGQGVTAVAPTASPLPALTAVTQPASLAASGFGAFSITTAAARYAINAAITAAESHDQARTISRPTIVTQDNVLGEVQQGVQIPIQTDINNTIAIQYVNATLDLSVTPQVTVDNKIFLKIYVNNASIGAISVLAGPTINTQEATTQVLVPDGGTVVFGGITVTTRGRSAAYVPLLGSIPVIGNLFKSSSVNDQNQELLFFVSPMILPG